MSTGTTASCRRTDEYLDRAFVGGCVELPSEVRAHLEACPRCAALFRWASSRQPLPCTSAELAGRIAARLAASLKPVKPLPPATVLAGRFVLIFGLLVLLLTAVVGRGGVENMAAVQFAAVGAVLGVAAAFMAFSLSWQMIPGHCQRAPAPLLIGVFAAGFFAVVAAMFPWEMPGQVFGAGWGCSGAGLAMALPVGLLLLILARRGAPLSYPTLGASLGALAGLLALTVLQLSCRNQSAGHILLWHGAVLGVSISAGYLLGRLAEHFAARRPPL